MESRSGQRPIKSALRTPDEIDVMGDAPDRTSDFSLTPEEERFFVRFFRRQMLPIAAGASVLAAVLVALLVAGTTGNDGPTLQRPHDPGPTESAGLAPPLVDEGARSRLERLENQLTQLGERLEKLATAPTKTAKTAGSPELAGEVAKLRRELGQLKKSLQTQSTTLAQLKDRPAFPAAPAAGDEVADLGPLTARLLGVEKRQDSEEKARLDTARELRARVFTLEEGRESHERRQLEANAQILQRLERLEQALLSGQ